jgi:hypothetical protein
MVSPLTPFDSHAACLQGRGGGIWNPFTSGVPLRSRR